MTSDPTPSKRTLLRRRVALVLHIVLGALLVAGALGTWWHVTLRERPFGSRAGWDREDRESPLQPLAAVAVLAAAVAFFFTSFDLASNADIQAPVLAASAVALVTAGVLTVRYLRDPYVLQEIDREVRQAGGDVAGVSTADRSLIQDAAVTRGWGLTLVQVAAPLMVLVSLYLTFLIERAPESST